MMFSVVIGGEGLLVRMDWGDLEVGGGKLGGKGGGGENIGGVKVGEGEGMMLGIK
jgi:hypothetical protein